MKKICLVLIGLFFIASLSNGNPIALDNKLNDNIITISLTDMKLFNLDIEPLSSNEVICNCSWWSWAWGNNNCLASNGGRRCSTGSDCQTANRNCGGEDLEVGELTPDPH